MTKLNYQKKKLKEDQGIREQVFPPSSAWDSATT